ncbi:DUF4231 domain-containing protein [Pseudomonas sp. dw_612]|uniref:DUF4231 domain-containing protein n=1 Tax=Pseudomonas sp. dw_612 TaxID=2720080 RepID=UPI001BD51BD3|nr:DUF4231 domain-containing protein [Pseudomonas sp. dw_612]
MCVKTADPIDTPETSTCTNRTDFSEIINDWLQRLVSAQRGHYTMSERLYNKSAYTGIALIISTVIVTALVLADAKDWFKWSLVALSVISAVLSGIVSFSRFSERAEQHRATASHYGKLRRKMEYLKAKSTVLKEEDIQERLKVLRIEWEYVSGNAPLTDISASPGASCCGAR